jgi:hypothetical protein
MPEPVKKGALILVCRSQNMDDFSWFKNSLLNHLRPLHNDQVSVVEIHTASDLIEGLSAPGTVFDVSEVHVLAEYGADSLQVGATPEESIGLGVLADQPPPRGMSINGGSFLPDTTVRVWYWSDNETPSFTQLVEWSEFFRLRFYFQPLAQLKQLIRPPRKLARGTSKGASAVSSATIDGISSAKAATAPSRTHAKDKRSGLQGTWLRHISMTNVVLTLAVLTAVHSVFFKSMIDLSNDYVDIVKHVDSSFEIEALTQNLANRGGDSVTHSWVFQRKRWDFTFFIATQWLEDSDVDLVRARKSAEGYQGHAFWASVYTNLVWSNGERLDNVADALRRYGERESMDEYELASFILAFVQHIPYKIPSNELGLLAPPQTVARYYGDCDSKSLLYVLILRKLGYRISMFESRRYRHAMAGVAVNATGTHMNHQGVDYYFAETTAVGHRLGSVAPRWNHLNNWRLVPL